MKLTGQKCLFFKSKHFKQKSYSQTETEKLIKHENKCIIGGFLVNIYNNIPLFLYKLILNTYSYNK